MLKIKKPLFIFLSSLALVIIGIRLIASNLQPNAEVLAMTLQSTGKIVIGGRFSDNRIMRKNVDGTDDLSFSVSWKVGGFNNAVLALATQSDDKIIAGGDFTNFDQSIVGYLVRLNADGSLDSSFTNAMGTGFDGQVSAISIQSDGKIMVGGDFRSFNGTSTPHIGRLNTNGTLDSTFVVGSGFNGSVLTIQPLSTGQILVGGQFTSYQNSPAAYFSQLLSKGPNDSQFSLKVTY